MPFVEGLRGFEEHQLATNRIFIANLTYRYPFIIDWGTGVVAGRVAGLLPGTNRSWTCSAPPRPPGTGRRGSPRAARCQDFVDIGVLPLSVRYQVSRRLTDDHGVVMFVMVGG